MPYDPYTGIPRGNDSYGQVMNAQGFIPFHRQSTFALGLDLGQTTDPTAIAVVERIVEPSPTIDSPLMQKGLPPRYECRWLLRMPLQTSYPDVVTFVANRVGLLPLRGNCRLIVDQ